MRGKVLTCVCVRVRQNSESVPASPSKFGVYAKVQRSTDSQRQKSGEKSGCVIPGSFHCLLLGGPHRFLQPLLVARVLHQLVCGTTLQLCSERRNRVPTPTAKISTSWGVKVWQAWHDEKEGVAKNWIASYINCSFCTGGCKERRERSINLHSELR